MQPELVAPLALTSHERGTVTSVLAIEASGAVSSVWVLRANNASVEAATARRLANTSFHPATCHGTPISTTLVMDLLSPGQ